MKQGYQAALTSSQEASQTVRRGLRMNGAHYVLRHTLYVRCKAAAHESLRRGWIVAPLEVWQAAVLQPPRTRDKDSDQKGLKDVGPDLPVNSVGC